MLKDHIESELKQALRAGDQLKLSVFRMLSAAIHNREIEQRTKSGAARDVALGEEDVMQVVRAEVKKRNDAAAAYEQGGRPDAAAQERAEADLLSTLLPPELSDEEIGALVREGAAALGVTSVKDFGKLMGWVMQRVAGRAPGERVGNIIKRELPA